MSTQPHCGAADPSKCTHPRCPDRVAFFQGAPASTSTPVSTEGQGPLARFNVDRLSREIDLSVEAAVQEFGLDERAMNEIARFALQDLQDTYRVSHKGEVDLYEDPAVLADLRTTIRDRINAQF